MTPPRWADADGDGDRPAGPAGPRAITGRQDLAAKADRWVAEGLITTDQAAGILEFEQGRAAPRSTLLAEVLAYLGGALVVAAVATVVASRWEDIALGGRLTILAVATAIGLAGGAVARTRPGPAFDRVTSVLWLASVIGVAGFTAVLVGDQGLDIGEDAIGAAVAGAASVAAIGLYALHPRALELLATGVSTTTFLVTLVVNAGNENPTTIGLALLAIGLAWVAQSLRPVLAPYWMGFLLGGIVAWIGSTTLAADLPLLGLGLGALGAAGLLALSVRTRDLLQLGVGALGLFITLPRLAIELFGSSIGGPLALLVVGVLVLVVALMAGRIGRRRGDTPSSPLEPPTAEPPAVDPGGR